MFMKTYMQDETAMLDDNEAFWWNRKSLQANCDLKVRYQKFIENLAMTHFHDDFAYEGIFDKKEDDTQLLKLDKSKMEASIGYASMRRGKLTDPEYNIKLNSSHAVGTPDNISNKCVSPISETNKQRVVTRIMKKNSFYNSMRGPIKFTENKNKKVQQTFSSTITKSKSMAKFDGSKTALKPKKRSIYSINTFTEGRRKQRGSVKKPTPPKIITPSKEDYEESSDSSNSLER